MRCAGSDGGPAEPSNLVEVEADSDDQVTLFTGGQDRREVVVQGIAHRTATDESPRPAAVAISCAWRSAWLGLVRCWW
jgi:hypothetical protein